MTKEVKNEVAEVNGVSLDSTITIGELVKRLGPRDRTRILKAFAKPDIQIDRESWTGAGRLLSGNAGRGDHAKFAKVVMVYLGDNEPQRVALEQFIAHHGKPETASKRRGRPRKET